jgi:hypothetical protein|tara:strand:+ start:398 stop:577 length:180 start_codon:yes stop_codon:yes gene_type:complete
MRIVYQDGKLYYSITKNEYENIEVGKPTEIDVAWLPHLVKDISEANLQHWKKELEKNNK